MTEYKSPINGQPLPRGKPFTSETAREARQKRTENDRANASIVAEFKKLINEIQTDKHGKKALGAEIIARSIMNGCINGNAKCIDQALAIMGEKPAEKVSFEIQKAERLDDLKAYMESIKAANCE